MGGLSRGGSTHDLELLPPGRLWSVEVTLAVIEGVEVEVLKDFEVSGLSPE